MSLISEASNDNILVPSDIKISKKEDDEFLLALRKTLDQQLTQLETFRYGWWQHWARLAEYILPRRYHWLIVANRTDRGFPINGNILDGTATNAARALAAGLMPGLTSPTRPWFRLGVGDSTLMQRQDVREWCDEVQRRMLEVMRKSNFYTSMATMYFDLVVFGTAVVLINEDDESVARCYNPCAGEFYLSASGSLRVTEMFRKFTLTLKQIVDMFGIDNVSEEMASDYRSAGAPLEREYIVAHAIQPNKPLKILETERYPVPKKFTFRETYWIYGGSNPMILAVHGFNEQPFMAPRWDTQSNEAYGRSPCMDALPDTMQLQFMTKREAQAVDKQVNPPLLADISLKNEPTSSVAGGLTYVAGLSNMTGMKPVYEVMPDLKGFEEVKKELQTRIKNTLFNDLFMMISQLDTVRSATEIDARREEKLVLLGPVIERLAGEEGHDIGVNRIFSIMHRKNLLPPPPPAIQGQEIHIQYISMLAEAQRAIGTAGIERLFQFAGNLAGVKPDIMDNLDADEAIDEYGDLLHVPARIIVDKKKTAAIRQQRAQKQEQAELLQQTVAGAKGAKDLSETNVGGQSLLQKIMGNA